MSQTLLTHRFQEEFLFLKSTQLGRVELSLNLNTQLINKATFHVFPRWIECDKASGEVPRRFGLYILSQENELIDSKAITAEINVREIGADKILFDISSNLDKKLVDFTNCSYESTVSSLTYKWWSSRESFKFDCSFIFKCNGHFDISAYFAKKLLSVEKDSNLKIVASLLNDDTYADFTFIVRGNEFKVHKFLLSAASEAFKTMFTCGLDQTKASSAIIDCNPEVFQHLLAFVYAKTVPFNEMHWISVDLHELAHRYGIKQLAMICREYIIRRKIERTNALMLYDLAATHGMKELLDSSWEFLKT